MRLPTTPAVALLRALRDDVRRIRPAGRVIAAVDGIDGAGKTTFADTWAEVFAEDGAAVYRASIDGFHRPRAERYRRGRTSAEGFYLDSYDYATFRRVLIDPFRVGAGAGFQLAVFDVARDTPIEAQWVTAPRDAVLLVDGIFLHRPELRDLWDWSVWLDVPEAVAAARRALRDGSDPDPAAPSNARYRDGQRRYIADADPRAAATAVVEYSDLAAPIRLPEGAR
ncbi:uridine kinase [Microbacterium sp. 10M-3C3]|jgi:uridine kinase|uniref:uridine kinase n=1 Tax=Microbacterium sp. 10M-3C3 TaxID=2483401 RepID=UPI000F63F1AE|nr:uridine kinase [Microbacterium sp. 10M-3C3]